MKKNQMLVTGPKVGRSLPVEWRAPKMQEHSASDLARAWIKTYTGRRFWPLTPRAEEVCIEDIAHALSLTCRFSGHTKQFYSVAQHSVLVCDLVPPKDKLAALLHDGSEAYLTDIPKPLKPFLHGYEEMEDRLMRVIAGKFKFDMPLPPCVKEADMRALAVEGRDLLVGTPDDWNIWVDLGVNWQDLASGLAVHPLPPWDAEVEFLRRYHELTRERTWH